MNRTARRLLVSAVAAGAAVTMTPTAANATIHEIVAQYCSGRAELVPPGVSDPAKKSFARPVDATGVAGGLAPVAGVGLVLQIDYDHPAAKVQPTGTYTQIGALPDGTGIFLPDLQPDPGFPAFDHCRALAP